MSGSHILTLKKQYFFWKYSAHGQLGMADRRAIQTIFSVENWRRYNSLHYDPIDNVLIRRKLPHYKYMKVVIIILGDMKRRTHF
jgi:hypothetical protein